MAKSKELYPLNGQCPEGHTVTSLVNGAGYCDVCKKGDAHEGDASEAESTGTNAPADEKKK